MSNIDMVLLVFLFLLLTGMGALLYYMKGILKKINIQPAQPGTDKKIDIPVPFSNKESRPVNNTTIKSQPVKIIPAIIAAEPQNQPADLKMVSLQQTRGNRNHLINGALIDLKESEMVGLKIVVDKPKRPLNMG